HRDFKPDNVLVDVRGRVVVTDFGLALTIDADALSTLDGTSRDEDLSTRLEVLSQTGAFVGTPAYMAPELFSGSQANASSDQFSFFVALHEALYGRLPFPVDSVSALIDAVTQGDPRAESADTVVPRRIRSVLLRGLSINPEDRFSDMRAVVAALRPRRVPWPWIMGAGLAAVSAVAILSTGQPRPEAYCDAVASRLNGVWDDSARERLRLAFDATALPYAASAADNAVTGLDGYALRWIEAQTAACRRQAGAQGTDVEADTRLAATMACLSTRHNALSALTDVVARADAQTVAGAADAIARLPAIGACASATAMAPSPPPDLAERVAALDRGLAHARAFHDAGMTEQALKVAQAHLIDARAVGFAPSTAAADVALGNALADAAQLAEAETAYHRGLSAGVASGFDRVGADAAAGLAYAAESRDESDDVARWVAMAIAALDAAPGPNIVRRAQMLSVLAVTQRNNKQLEQAERTHREAIAAMKPLLAADHYAFAAHYSGLGLTLAELGEHAEAAAFLAQARDLLRSTYGERHPQFGAGLQNTATSHLRRGAYAQALVSYRAAHEVMLAAYGPEHVATGTTAYSVGAAFALLGRFDEARRYAEQGHHGYESVLGPDSAPVEMVWSLRGEIELRAGRLQAAEPALRAALRIAGLRDDPWRRAGYLAQLGNLQRLAGDYDTAEATLTEARDLQAEYPAGATVELAETLGWLAALHLDGRGQPTHALPFARRSWEVHEAQQPDVNTRADAALLLARALVAVDPASATEATALVRARLLELDGLGEASSHRGALTRWLAAH
ncbi:MAG: tetratricopeptide repeat protein, partial [Nannocystaceae bacterium]|nr:tetratricopeptide repeat protein [Nannocystaceae bacterium]